MVVGAGHDALPLQTTVTESADDPDIAVLLVATSEKSAVPLVVIVLAPDTWRITRVQVMVTALPEIDPLIALVTMVTPAGAVNWTVPEIDVPV